MLIFKGRNRVTSAYRLPERPDHTGIDIVGDDSRDVHAVRDGTVYQAQAWDGKTKTGMQSYGNVIIIKGADGCYYYYAHLKSYCVKQGQAVKAGDVIGVMGNTGNSFGAHTHFEVRAADRRTTKDPAAVLGITNAKGSYYANGWQQVSGKWYYYKDGKPLKGQWVQDGGWWYWLGANGVMATGWQKIGGKLYWLNEKRAEGVPKGALPITDSNGAVQMPTS